MDCELSNSRVEAFAGIAGGVTEAGNSPLVGLTEVGNATYDEGVGIFVSAPCRSSSQFGCEANLASNLVPVRSTVGQLPLEQHIGVRIPDGQPIRINKLERQPDFQSPDLYDFCSVKVTSTYS